jgi:hypothetical protein
MTCDVQVTRPFLGGVPAHELFPMKVGCKEALGETE